MSKSKKRNALNENSEEKDSKRARYVEDEDDESLSLPEKILKVEQYLSEKLMLLTFPNPVKFVYNPIDYAFEIHAEYVRRFCNNPKKILFLGMNPGPWGMAQTGVPFGEVSMVKDWFKLSGSVGKPPQEHPDRKVTGLECTRSEVSGKRLWGLFKELCGEPDNFFREVYLHNYCPVSLMDHKGKNITPADLKGSEQRTLHLLCDEVLVYIVKVLTVEIIVGIGKFAEKRADTIVKNHNLNIKVLSIPHPSPRSVGNNNWGEKAQKKLEELDLLKYITKQEA